VMGKELFDRNKSIVWAISFGSIKFRPLEAKVAARTKRMRPI